jgi:hypothetical protein
MRNLIHPKSQSAASHNPIVHAGLKKLGAQPQSIQKAIATQFVGVCLIECKSVADDPRKRMTVDFNF